MPAYLFLPVALLAALSSPAATEIIRHRPPADWAISLAATPNRVTAKCPVTINFIARLQMHGATNVTYQFVRSDSGTGAVMRLAGQADGAELRETWTLGNPLGLPKFNGWMQLKVWYEKHNAGAMVVSNQAKFQMHCAA